VNGEEYTVADRAMLLDAMLKLKNLKYYVTTKVTDMSGLFRGKTYFNDDISGWDVSNVTDMNRMFLYAHKFNRDISNWNIYNVKDMELMFSEARFFNQDLSQWNTRYSEKNIIYHPFYDFNTYSWERKNKPRFYF